MLIKDISKLNHTSQNSLFAAIFVIALAAMYQWIFNPHVKYLNAAQRYDSVLDKYMERNKALNNQIKIKTEQIETLSNQLSQAANTVFTPSEARNFFGSLQNSLEKTGCAINTLNLVGDKNKNKRKQSDESTGITANSASLNFSGPYKSIIGIIEKMQKHNPKVWIDSFNIEINDYNSSWLKCNMTITIFTVQDKEQGL
jgi:hypothetical protein